MTPAPTAPPAPDSEAGISSLSRLLLEGWTMLSTTCPTASCHMPLARSRDGRVTCTACATDIPAAPSSSSPTSAPTHTEPSTAVVVPSSARRPQVSVSAILGEKLLQGWTMLSDSCARCSTPLLRDASGTLLCVSCSPERASDAPPPPPPHAGSSPGPGSEVVRANGAGNSNGQVARGVHGRVSRDVAGASASARGADGRGAADAGDAGGSRARAHPLPALPAPPLEGEMSGAWHVPQSNGARAELEASETAVLAIMARLRARALEVRDVPAALVVCEAIGFAAEALRKIREAVNAVA